MCLDLREEFLLKESGFLTRKSSRKIKHKKIPRAHIKIKEESLWNFALLSVRKT